MSGTFGRKMEIHNSNTNKDITIKEDVDMPYGGSESFFGYDLHAVLDEKDGWLVSGMLFDIIFTAYFSMTIARNELKEAQAKVVEQEKEFKMLWEECGGFTGIKALKNQVESLKKGLT